MPVAWRLVKAEYAATPLDGEGARRFGGRWSSPGIRAVYASESLALAALEVLVHLQSTAVLDRFVTIGVQYSVPALDAPAPPPDWRLGPAPASTRRLGDAWLSAGAGLALRVPSVVVPRERNLIFNPAHPGFRHLRVVVREPFSFDARLGRRET